MDGWKIAVEANGGKPVPMEEAKPLEAGCSTALVAALDPALKSITPTKKLLNAMR